MFLHKTLADWLRDVTTFGGTPFYAIITAITFLVGQATLAIALLSGFLITMAVVVAIRTFYYKDRPKKEMFHNYLERLDASSFPSWHTARAFFLAFTFSSLMNNAFFTFLLLGIALLTAYSRIYLKKHDLVDILGGMVLAGVAYWIAGLL